MKLKRTDNWFDDCIKDMAKAAVENRKAFEYMVFWTKESSGWQKKAKQYLREAIKEGGNLV